MGMLTIQKSGPDKRQNKLLDFRKLIFVGIKVSLIGQND